MTTQEVLGTGGFHGLEKIQFGIHGSGRTQLQVIHVSLGRCPVGKKCCTINQDGCAREIGSRAVVELEIHTGIGGLSAKRNLSHFTGRQVHNCIAETLLKTGHHSSVSAFFGKGAHTFGHHHRTVVGTAHMIIGQLGHYGFTKFFNELLKLYEVLLEQGSLDSYKTFFAFYDVAGITQSVTGIVNIHSCVGKGNFRELGVLGFGVARECHNQNC